MYCETQMKEIRKGLHMHIKSCPTCSKSDVKKSEDVADVIKDIFKNTDDKTGNNKSGVDTSDTANPESKEEENEEVTVTEQLPQESKGNGLTTIILVIIIAIVMAVIAFFTILTPRNEGEKEDE